MAEIENVVIIDRFDYDELVEKSRMTDEEIKNKLNAFLCKKMESL